MGGAGLPGPGVGPPGGGLERHSPGRWRWGFQRQRSFGAVIPLVPRTGRRTGTAKVAGTERVGAKQGPQLPPENGCPGGKVLGQVGPGPGAGMLDGQPMCRQPPTSHVSTTRCRAKREIREIRDHVAGILALVTPSPSAESGQVTRLIPVRNCRISGTRRAIRPGPGNPLPDTVRGAFPQLGEEWLPDWGGVANSSTRARTALLVP